MNEDIAEPTYRIDTVPGREMSLEEAGDLHAEVDAKFRAWQKRRGFHTAPSSFELAQRNKERRRWAGHVKGGAK